MLRLLLLATLAGCPRAQPTPQPIEWTRPCPDCREDAGAAAAMSAPAIDAGGLPDVPRLGGLFKQDGWDLASTDAGTIASSGLIAPVDAAMPSSETEVEYEDGVPVVRQDKPAWCAVGGKLSDMCFEHGNECAHVAGKCEPHKAWACFTYETRTEHRSEIVCAVSYGLCTKYHRLVEIDDENSNLSDCVIFRVREKRKGK